MGIFIEIKYITFCMFNRSSTQKQMFISKMWNLQKIIKHVFYASNHRTLKVQEFYGFSNQNNAIKYISHVGNCFYVILFGFFLTLLQYQKTYCVAKKRGMVLTFNCRHKVQRYGEQSCFVFYNLNFAIFLLFLCRYVFKFLFCIIYESF